MTEKLRQDLVTAFEYCYLHDDWVYPLQEAVEGVTVEQALWKATPDGKCIWDIVLHMAVWNENIVERVETGENVRPQEGAWPELPTSPNEDCWHLAQKRLWKSLGAVQHMLEKVAWEKVESSPYGLPDILCRCIHNAYHLGQIEKIRQIQQHS